MSNFIGSSYALRPKEWCRALLVNNELFICIGAHIFIIRRLFHVYTISVLCSVAICQHSLKSYFIDLIRFCPTFFDVSLSSGGL